MIDLLLVSRGVEMLIESLGGVELLMADIALPVKTIECAVGDRIFGVLFFMPFNLPVGNNTVRVTLANHAVDGVAVEIWGVSA